MKVFKIDWAKALMMILMLSMIACSKNDDDSSNSVPDPEGTMTANMTESTGASLEGINLNWRNLVNNDAKK
ncbi:MAG: hypothetical protein LBP85_09850 [Prevotellaceae bacterium]|jgi:hypothetical protein|nr:hypothetical protein [Prevotellaceae bacterium]